MLILNWEIEALRSIRMDSLRGVIKEVFWRCSAQDNEYSSTSYGSKTLNDPNPNNFISVDSVTKSQVLVWLWETLDRDKVELELANEISRKKDVPEPVPSWAKNVY